MAALIDRLMAVGIDAALAATVWSALIALAMVGCRQPSRRIQLARSANLGLLVIWPLAMLPMPRIPASEVFRGTVVPAESAPDMGTPGPPGPTSRKSGHPWRPAITVAYLVGVLTVAARFGVGVGVSTWLRRRAITPRPTTQHILKDLAAQERGKPPELGVSRLVRRPLLVGVFRPTILIPPHLERPIEAERLRLCLCHERIHAERGDSRALVFSAMAEILWFFLPQVHWIQRQVRLDQEYLVDIATARRLGLSRFDYARTLVELAPPVRATPVNAISTPAHEGDHGTLTSRVLMLLRCPYPFEDRTPAWWTWTVLPAAFWGILVLSTLNLRGALPLNAGVADTSTPLRSVFRIDQLVVECDHDRRDGRTCLLPVPLPARFDLDFEIQARPIDLPLFQLAGLHIAPPFPEKTESAFLETEPVPWLRVRVRREKPGLAQAWVDEKPATVRPARGAIRTRLSVHAPTGRTARLRRLTLSE